MERFLRRLRLYTAGNATVRAAGLVLVILAILRAACRAWVWLPMLAAGLLGIALTGEHGAFRAFSDLLAVVGLLACLARAADALPLLAAGLLLILLSRPNTPDLPDITDGDT